MKYRRLLVPMDGSPLAELVLPYVIDLSARLNADVTVLSVCEKSDDTCASLQNAYVEKIAAELKEQVAAKRRALKSDSTETPAISGVTEIGYPAEEILHFSEETGVDLIVMATHGYSGIKRWALGSIADKVLRKSMVPVLLDRAGVVPENDCTDWYKKTMIVPLDGSELAESVIPHIEAISENQTQMQDVVLLRVCEPPSMPSYYPPNVPALPQDYIRSATEVLKSTATKYLDGIAERLKAKGLNVTSELLEGKPADAILKYTADHPCNLIVMSTHGRSGVSRWVYGSVAERILNKASSPILLVRPQVLPE